MLRSIQRSVSSGSDTEPTLAVDVQNVVFSYKPNVKVLNKVSLKVMQGKICAILGADGSGKSTLLRLISGRLRPRIGRIRVFDKQPGIAHPDIPGPGIGFMSQESGLYQEFTVKENLIYYGMICHLNGIDCEQRISKLTKLWCLEDNDKRVNQLSRDKQKVVSIACAMIHNPKLLVLDEPTVGIDSLLRYKMWDQLEKYNREHGTTIIITSNYISEARRAHTIAFMYSGKCMRYGRPYQVLSQYGCRTLEEVYHQLCVEFIRKSKESFKYVLEEEENKRIRMQDILSERPEDLIADSNKKSIDFNHLKALIWSNAMSSRNHKKFLSLFLLLPIFQILLINLCFGWPKSVPIGVFNGEDRPELSKAFIDRIDEDFFRKTLYESNDSAINSVINGENWLSLGFSSNFSDKLKKRYLDPYELTRRETKESVVQVFADMSDPVTAYISQFYLMKTFDKFVHFFRLLMGHNAHVLSSPVTIKEVVYGKTDLGFESYVYPGIVMAAIHFNAIFFTIFCAFHSVKLKNEFLERTLISGVSNLEVLCGQSLSVILLAVIQSLIVTHLLFFTYEYGLNVNILYLFLLLLLQSLQGLAFGTTIALVCQRTVSCVLVLVSVLVPIWLTSGVFWPIESIPTLFQQMAIFSPLYPSVQSFRYIVFRGWTLFDSLRVLFGYLSLISNIIIFTTINVILVNKI